MNELEWNRDHMPFKSSPSPRPMDRSEAEAIENVRRYCELTLESISIERRVMAEDVLSLLPNSAA